MTLLVCGSCLFCCQTDIHHPINHLANSNALMVSDDFFCVARHLSITWFKKLVVQQALTLSLNTSFQNNFLCDCETLLSSSVSVNAAHIRFIFWGKVKVQKAVSTKKLKMLDVYDRYDSTVFNFPNCSRRLRSGPTVYIYIFNFLNSGYWLTDPLPGFHQWARRLLLEPQWEPSWQLPSIKLSSTPSSKATREVSIPCAFYTQSSACCGFQLWSWLAANKVGTAHAIKLQLHVQG